jgi:hypothetical protein
VGIPVPGRLEPARHQPPAPPVDLLRQAADGISLFRRCIEIRKDHMTGLDWAVTISQDAVENARRKVTGHRPGRRRGSCATGSAPRSTAPPLPRHTGPGQRVQVRPVAVHAPRGSVRPRRVQRSTRGTPSAATCGPSRSSTAPRSSRSSTSAAAAPSPRTRPTSRSCSASPAASSPPTPPSTDDGQRIRRRLRRRPAHLLPPRHAGLDPVRLLRRRAGPGRRRPVPQAARVDEGRVQPGTSIAGVYETPDRSAGHRSSCWSTSGLERRPRRRHAARHQARFLPPGVKPASTVAPTRWPSGTSPSTTCT